MASARIVAEKTEVCYVDRRCAALHLPLRHSKGRTVLKRREGQVGTRLIHV